MYTNTLHTGSRVIIGCAFLDLKSEHNGIIVQPITVMPQQTRSRRGARIAKTVARQVKYIKHAGMFYKSAKAIKAKLSRSRHTTTTKSKTKTTQMVKSPVVGLSNSSKTIKYKISKGIRQVFREAPIATYMQADGFSNSGGYGIQTINSNSTASSGQELTLWATNAALTSFNTQLGPATGRKSYRLAVKGYGLEYLYTNQSPNTIILTHYDCISKITKPIRSQTINDWTNGLADQNPTSGTSGTANASFPGQCPTASKLFNITWHIVKKVMIELAPGRSHRHVFNMKCNRIVDLEYAAQYDQIKGLTYAQIAVQHALCVDTTSTTTSGVVTLNNSKVDCVVKKWSFVQYASVMPRVTITQNNLPLIPSAVTEFTMDELTGAAIQVGTTGGVLFG